MYKGIIMWTFPLVSIFLSFLLWKEKVPKQLLLFLGVGLTLQVFSYGPILDLFAVKAPLFPILGKGFLVGIIYFHFGLNSSGKITSKGWRTQAKLFLLVGMILFTVANFKSLRMAEGLATILLIVFPAIFFKVIKNYDIDSIFAFLGVSVSAFFAFLIEWIEKIEDPFQLTPLIWMICFAIAFYLVGKVEEEN